MVRKKGKGANEPKAQTAGAYPGSISMKHLGVLLLPPGQDASPSQGYPPRSMSPVPINTLGWRETKWSKAPCLRKQQDERARLEPQTSRSGIRGVNHSATHASTSYDHATCKISSLFHFREGMTYLGQNENDHKTTTTFYCLNYISMV